MSEMEHAFSSLVGVRARHAAKKDPRLSGKLVRQAAEPVLERSSWRPGSEDHRPDRSERLKRRAGAYGRCRYSRVRVTRRTTGPWV